MQSPQQATKVIQNWDHTDLASGDSVLTGDIRSSSIYVRAEHVSQDFLYAGVHSQQPLPKVVEDKYVSLKSGLSMSDGDLLMRQPEESTHVAAGRLVFRNAGPGAAA